MVEPLMLGLTTYQEALRALGPLVDAASDVRIVEQAQDAWIEITTAHGTRQIGIAQLEEIVLNSHARRGVADNGPGASQSDVLRSVGLALDELRACNVRVDLTPCDCVAEECRELHNHVNPEQRACTAHCQPDPADVDDGHPEPDDDFGF